MNNEIKNITLKALEKNKIQQYEVKFANGKKLTRKLNRFADEEAYNNFKSEVSNLLKEAGFNNNDKGSKWNVERYRRTLKEAVDHLFNVNSHISEETFTTTLKENKNAGKVAGFILGATATIGAVSLGACGFFDKEEEPVVTETVTEDTVVEEKEAPVPEVKAPTVDIEELSLEGKDWDWYVANADDTFQKEFFTETEDFLMEINNSEDWMEKDITPEMKEELEKIGIFTEGDKYVEGIEVEELVTARIINGRYSNEELAAIMHGQRIDVDSLVNSTESEYNQFIRAVQRIYLNGDKQHYGFDKILGFNEIESQALNHFEDELFEIKNLFKKGKTKEAEAKLKEVKSEIVAYAYATNDGQEKAKPFILKTLYEDFNILSNLGQFKDTVEVHLYDSIDNVDVYLEIETDLYDEITNRKVNEGFLACYDNEGNEIKQGFNSIEFLKKFNLDSNRYEVIVDDNGVSKSNQFNSDLIEFFDDYNNYLSKNPDIAEAIKNTYKPEEIIELMKQFLIKNNKQPLNTQAGFTDVLKTPIIELFFKIKGLDGNSKAIGTGNGETRKVIKQVLGQYTTREVTHTFWDTYKETETRTESVSEDDPENVAAKDKAVKEASTMTVKDQNGNTKEVSLQDYYDAQFNKNGAVDTQPTVVNPTDTAETKKDLAAIMDQWAKEDAEANAAAHAAASQNATSSYKDEQGNTHYVSGGELHYDDMYEGTKSFTEQEANEFNSTHEVGENQAQENGGLSGPEVLHEDGFVPVETPVIESFSSEADVDAYVDSLVNTPVEETSDEITK